MIDREKVKKGLDLCLTGEASACKDCPYDAECKEVRGIGPSPLRRDALELLKQPEDKELHLDDLDMLVNMIAIKAKAEGRFFSPYEVGLALVQRGQHDERFKWGEVIKYSPSEVEQILKEVEQNADD